MTRDAKPDLDENARFYLLFSELGKVDEQPVATEATSDEINEIEQVMRMVVDVNDEPPQFVTST
jgi:hypothetical protein